MEAKCGGRRLGHNFTSLLRAFLHHRQHRTFLVVVRVTGTDHRSALVNTMHTVRSRFLELHRVRSGAAQA